MKPICIVTGASGGIGGAIALEMARRGNRVALGCFSNEEAAQALCGRILSMGEEAICLPFDARDEKACEDAVLTVTKAWGPPNILVHCAGHALQAQIQDVSPKQWRDMFALHMDAAFYLSRAAIPSMVEQKSGCILLISSMWGQVGASMEVPYSAAKAAQIGFAKALAKELGPCNIRVNCLCPGAVQTPMNDGFPLDEIIEETPLLRLGSPEEIAKAAAFLCSDDAAFITGQVLGVNGGLVM